MAFIGLCKCGKWLFVAVDLPDKETRGFITRSTMRVLRGGGTVSRQSVVETRDMVKKSASKCTCQKAAPDVVQRSLFDDAEVQDAGAD